jgi:hypothetical protein
MKVEANEVSPASFRDEHDTTMLTIVTQPVKNKNISC